MKRWGARFPWLDWYPVDRSAGAVLARLDERMSQLKQLKESINSLAKGATDAGNSLGQFEQQFNKQAQAVQQVIGGSAQGKDRQVLEAIQQASRAVKEATAALQNAGRIAQQYGQSI